MAAEILALIGKLELQQKSLDSADVLRVFRRKKQMEV